MCLCVCMCCEYVLNVAKKKEKEGKYNKCVRLVTNFNPFPSYFTAYLVIDGVEVFVVDICMPLCYHNEHQFPCILRMKNWQKCFSNE